MAVGVLLALVTSASWAFGNVYVQRAGRAAGVARGLLWSMIAGGGMAAICSIVFDPPMDPIGGQTILWAAISGAFGLLAYACIFYSFARAQLSVAVPLVSSWSVVAAAVSYFALGERVAPAKLGAAAVVILGVTLVSLGGARAAATPVSRRETRRALLAAAGSAVGFGVMVPSLARVSPALGEFGASALVYAVGIALGVPLLVAAREDVRPPLRRLWPLVALTGFFEIFGFVTIAFARRFAPIAVVTPVASLASTLTVLYAWVVLKERPGRVAAVGAALACAGVVALSR